MQLARIYARGQITIPKEARAELGVKSGDLVAIESRGDELVIRRPVGILELDGLGTPKSRDKRKNAREIARRERIEARIRR